MNFAIIPSAPFKNYEEIERLAHKCVGKVERIQIDVCDGKYVPSLSWPFTEYNKADFQKLSEKKDLDVFLPDWDNLNYSADMMTENPEKYIESLVAYGIDEIIIHFRSNPNWEKIFELVKSFDLNLVLAVDVKTDLKYFLEFSKNNFLNINAFQVMGIEKIGFQGQEFSEESLEIVKTLKTNFPKKNIYFDGGINEDTVEEIKDVGVTTFCVGSYLTKTENFNENLNYLKKVL